MASVAVIPARWGSTRFPGKPLVRLQGRELLARVIDGARTSKRVARLIVATDDDRIAELARREGVAVAMTPSELATGTDRIWAAIQSDASVRDEDIVVNVQGDEPLILGETLDALVGAFDHRAELSMATLGRRLDLGLEADRAALSLTTTAKILVNVKGEAIYFSRYPIPFSRKPAESAQGEDRRAVYKHVGIYAYRRRFLREFCAAPPCFMEQFEGLEQLRALWLGARIQVVETTQESWGVDTPQDVEKIEALLNARSPIGTR
ncbi:MAG TPA: 3-deoxy-manno-octulosonate cytidylyltransferase [Pseudobdellovibrionaceae bacterium]|nr:3-deoxy-manno-octulosonate cytidylyltransferase [Pseudobdellovibrionaceae bacterium]